MISERFKLVPYRSKAYEYVAFSCGNQDMDAWLQSSAGQNERNNRARTFLLVDAGHESRKIYGYFALVNYQVVPEDAALILGRDYGYPMPATLMIRLAVSKDAQGEGLGALLLAKAMEFTLAALDFSGSEVFIVDAIDGRATSFYQRHGLKLLKDDGRRLFIPTRKISASLDAVNNSA